MPHILSLTQKENLAVSWLKLDSGGYQNLPSTTKMHLLSPFTSESPSPPAICFWISLADGHGFRSCQLSWMSIIVERGTHLILSAGKRVFPHQNKKPFFGFPPYSDPGNVRLCFGIIWHPISFTSVRFKRSAHDLLKFFAEYQTHHLLSSQQQSIVSSLPKSVVSFPTNHAKWCPIVSTWCSLVSSIQCLIYLPENRTVNLLIA